MNRLKPNSVFVLVLSFVFAVPLMAQLPMITHGAYTRGDTIIHSISLIFSGDEFGEGLGNVRSVLKNENIKSSFFFTGRFYRNKNFIPTIKKLIKDGHYLGPHSDLHLLYCDWVKRDSLLLTRKQFDEDLIHNYEAIHRLNYATLSPKYFLPPYEWYNDTISAWAHELGIQLINFTPGTLSHTDYTTLKDKNYRDNQTIFNSIVEFEQKNKTGLNGFILLMHIGAGPGRKEKFYERLPALIRVLKLKEYHFVRLDELLGSRTP